VASAARVERRASPNVEDDLDFRVVGVGGYHARLDLRVAKAFLAVKRLEALGVAGEGRAVEPGRRFAHALERSTDAPAGEIAQLVEPAPPREARHAQHAPIGRGAHAPQEHDSAEWAAPLEAHARDERRLLAGGGQRVSGRRIDRLRSRCAAAAAQATQQEYGDQRGGSVPKKKRRSARRRRRVRFHATARLRHQRRP